jgi:hypothetical protein
MYHPVKPRPSPGAGSRCWFLFCGGRALPLGLAKLDGQFAGFEDFERDHLDADGVPHAFLVGPCRADLDPRRVAFIAHPEHLEEIVKAHWRQEQETANREATERDIEQAMHDLPRGQEKLVLFGSLLWPPVAEEFRRLEYDYDQVRTAAWYFRDINKWLRNESPASRAIYIRLSTRWFQEYLDRCNSAGGSIKRVLSLIRLMARLLENNPDGECVYPISPYNGEGQW